MVVYRGVVTSGAVKRKQDNGVGAKQIDEEYGFFVALMLSLVVVITILSAMRALGSLVGP